MSKPLNSLQLQAVELIARGASESEVSKLCGKSRSWVQNLKRRADFQAVVENALSQEKWANRELLSSIIICDSLLVVRQLQKALAFLKTA